MTRPWLRRRVATLTLAVVCLPGLAQGFALFPDRRAGTVEEELAGAARWSPEPDPFAFGTGFHDGLQVAVAADFAARLQLGAPEDIALLEQVIRLAFEAWETPDLRFDIDWSRTPEEGTQSDGASGYEIDLFAVPQTHPAFVSESYYGLTFQRRRIAEGRLLSNGARRDGWVITGVDIFINVDLVLQLGGLLPREQKAQALQRLLMHEIGHGIGLGHPNLGSSNNNNFDTDADPFNPMILDPYDPFGRLLHSDGRNPRAIMSNDRTRVGSHLFYTELQNDDRGGRDALYPSLRTCPADCSGDGRVHVAELITAVNAALGFLAVESCHRADRDTDGEISIDELIAGVRAVLDGCFAGEG
jgi:hypothetical protein